MSAENIEVRPSINHLREWFIMVGNKSYQCEGVTVYFGSESEANTKADSLRAAQPLKDAITYARFIGDARDLGWWYPGRPDLTMNNAEFSKRLNEFEWKMDVGDEQCLWPFVEGKPLMYGTIEDARKLDEARAAHSEQSEPEPQVEHMVQRFLTWRLPEDFNPDNGISFKPTFNDHFPEPMKCNPVGTNLFDYTQTKAMVRHMLEGMSAPALAASPSPAQPRIACGGCGWLLMLIELGHGEYITKPHTCAPAAEPAGQAAEPDDLSKDLNNICSCGHHAVIHKGYLGQCSACICEKSRTPYQTGETAYHAPAAAQPESDGPEQAGVVWVLQWWEESCAEGEEPDWVEIGAFIYHFRAEEELKRQQTANPDEKFRIVEFAAAQPESQGARKCGHCGLSGVTLDHIEACSSGLLSLAREAVIANHFTQHVRSEIPDDFKNCKGKLCAEYHKVLAAHTGEAK